MRETDILRLQHMLDAAREAISFAQGRKRRDLDADRMLMHALVREVEIIGEAATKISTETRKHIAEIEWKTIIGMRNRLIHAYFDINLDVLWNTIIYDIPDLIEELERLPELR